MKTLYRAAMLVGAALITTMVAPATAQAQDEAKPEGHWQLKLFGTGVLPDGKIKSVKAVDLTTTLGATVAPIANPQTVVSDNGVPTVAIEYFFTPNVSLETICCVSAHHVDGVGALAGAKLVGDVYLIPATFSLKYHVAAGPIRPYVGVGPSVFIMLHSKPGATSVALNVTRTKLTSEIGAVFQGGVDIPIGHKGLGISLDVKKYLMTTDAHFYQGAKEALVTHHKLDPLVVSAGITCRF